MEAEIGFTEAELPGLETLHAALFQVSLRERVNFSSQRAGMQLWLSAEDPFT